MGSRAKEKSQDQHQEGLVVGVPSPAPLPLTLVPAAALQLSQTLMLWGCADSESNLPVRDNDYTFRNCAKWVLKCL